MNEASKSNAKSPEVEYSTVVQCLVGTYKCTINGSISGIHHVYVLVSQTFLRV